MSLCGCPAWVVELASISRPQEAHQAHGPVLLLESSPKHGEGAAYIIEQAWPDSFSGRKFRGQQPSGGRVTPPIKASSCCTWPRPDSALGNLSWPPVASW